VFRAEVQRFPGILLAAQPALQAANEVTHGSLRVVRGLWPKRTCCGPRTTDTSRVLIVERGYPERSTKKPLPDAEKKRRARHDLISPGRTGWELAPASPLRPTGCCGFSGPVPSATLDKILTKLSVGDCRG